MFYAQYQLTFSLLSVVGISWREENSRCKIIQRTVVHLTFVSTILTLISTSILMEYSWDLYLETMTYAFAIAGAVTGYYGILYKFYEMTRIVRQMEMDWEELEDSEELRIMVKYAKRSNFLTVILMYAIANILVASIFMSMLPIVLDSLLPLNTTRERQFITQLSFVLNDNFIEIVIIQHVLIIVYAFLALSSYTFFMVIIQHIQSRFDIIGHKLQCAFQTEDGISKANRDERVYKMIVQSIRYHNGTIGFVSFLNSTTEIYYSIDIVLGICYVSVLVLHIFQINDQVINLHRWIRNLSISVCCVIYVFLNCYIGQSVLDSSSRIFDTVYSVPWYQTSTKVQKMILFIMMRSKTASCIEFGKIFVSSLQLFGRLTHTAISYAMLLYSTNK